MLSHDYGATAQPGNIEELAPCHNVKAPKNCLGSVLSSRLWLFMQLFGYTDAH